jgi:hypothetical protein
MKTKEAPIMGAEYRYPWQQICASALAEVDPDRFPSLLKVAKEAIQDRLQELSTDDDPEEWEALEYAGLALRDRIRFDQQADDVWVA